MAHDIRKGKDVALKIMVSENAGEDEHTMQTEIICTVQDTSNFLTYLTTFILPGHLCSQRVLVFPVRGPSLRSCLGQMSMATRMSAARQSLKALECLRNGRIVHRGELIPAYCSLSVHANIFYRSEQQQRLWGIAPLDDLNTKTKYTYLGRPQKLALPFGT
jgi:hypothetical protein